MRRAVAAAALLCLVFSCLAFSQGGNAQLGGVVSDESGALVPGVTITVTNTDTGVVNTTITNESGAYNFPSLLPGRAYRASASLPGFQTKTVTNLELGTAVNFRQDFQLQVAAQATSVEVSIEANQLLTLSSQSVGEVLTESRVRELPLVGSNVLDLVGLVAGVRGDGNTANFAGVGAGQINTVRDGLSVSDGRFVNGVFGSTFINPDLVGEIRVILTPVDAEMGRGNGQVQIQTRSGTNKFSGAAVWNVQNSGLNPNTWGNNNDIDPATGAWKPTVPNWFNNHQYTLSYGGPIIRNKTFFYALWDQQLNYQRNIVTASVLTDTARQGIYRFWSGWNNGNAEATETTGTNAATSSVDFSGAPKTPQYNARANGTSPLVPYTGALTCFSVFGNMKIDSNGNMVPFTSADCPGGNAIINASPWDSRRPVVDPTGYVQKILGQMPRANYFGTGSGDGLNVAAYRFLRGRNGDQGASVTTGTDTNVNRKQLNIKVDHNFNSSHKVSASWTRERNDTFSDVPNWPDGISYKTKRYPQVLTVNATSTLSSTLLNEGRFGIRYNRAGVDAPWEDQYGDAEIQALAQSYMLMGSDNFLSLVRLGRTPGAGQLSYQFGGTANGVMNTNPGQYNGNISPLYNYADTVSWTVGKHAFKFGGEARFTKTKAYSNIGAGSQVIMNLPTLIGGPGANTSPLATAAQTTLLPSSLLLGTNRTSATDMLYFLAASINNAQMVYWIDDFSDIQNGKWENVNTIEGGRKYRETVINEYSAFAKDDWKISKDVTLNLGLRYDIYGSPYISSGFTSTTIGKGYGLFGVGAPASGNIFSNWLNPGNIYLTGYGPNASPATALSCANGVTQSGLLPASNCDPNMLTTLEFVGPKTPNPSKTIKPSDRNNFGPAVGFSWNVPWFSDSHATTVRGGYQITFGGSGRNVGGGFANTLEVVAGGAPGALSNASTVTSELTAADVGADLYVDLMDVQALVPVRPTSPALPGGVLNVYGRTLNPNISAYDPNYVDPYTQNFNFSVTSSLTRKLTLDVRYIGTVSRKQESQINPNTAVVFNNPELFDAIEMTRQGLNAPLFDQMLAGLNLNSGVAGYGPVGSCVTAATAPGAGQEGCPAGQVLQHGSAHLRRNATFRGNIANGNYAAVAASLNGNGSTLPAVGATGGFTALPSGISGVGGRLLRNGCDRMATGQAVVSAVLPTAMRCFPENYLVANPQLNNPTLLGNAASSNYHSLQTQVTLRPTLGFSWQATYTWSKNLGVPGSGYTDPSNRNLDYAPTTNDRRHDFRSNGTFELPIGPNKLVLGNSAGWLARAIERWQAGMIFNWTSGGYSTISAGTTRYANGTADVVGPFNLNDGKATWGYSAANGTLVGNYFTNGAFTRVEDPQCQITNHTDTNGFNLYNNGDCTIDALADANTGQILLQNAAPGTVGNLGRFTMRTLGTWSLDANLGKTFRISESKSLQVRIDTTNVLNHPNLNAPNLGVNSDAAQTPFGQITTKGNNTRQFQGQVRFAF